MDEMFGLSMNTIMIVLLALLAVSVSAVLFIFVRHRIMFLMGLRNIPRRIAQTVLIIVGLMLSTVIITAAFTTGDTVDYSITKQAYDLLGHADVILDGEVGGSSLAPGDDEADISGEEYELFLRAADDAGLQNIDGYTGALFEAVPVINLNTNLSEPDLAFMGIDVERIDAFPDFRDASNGSALDLRDLGPGEVYLNESGADELGASAGDVLQVWVQGTPHEYTVRAIAEDTGAAGAIDQASPEGMVAALPEVQQLVDEDGVTLILVSANGGVRDALPNVAAAEDEVNEIIRANPDLRIEVSDTKVEIVDEAEEIGNFMTTFFLLLGLFSIGAGMLLIVMIFVMLAAERKSEMGMARAVGMKRFHLIETFLAEGEAYNLAAAIVGVTLGVLVAFALTTAASAMFSSWGLSFTPHVTLRTIVISYSLGAVLTFVTVAFSSWRTSNLNIVSAIRDTEENKQRNPEYGTFRGYVRSVMHAFVAIALFPLGTLMYVLRGSNFAASREERYDEPPAPWFPLLQGILGFPFYQIAMLITGRKPIPMWPFFIPLFGAFYLVPILIYRLLRDHRPRSLGLGVTALGALFAFPAGVVVAALDDPRKPITWGPGVWTLMMLLSVYFVVSGLQSDTAFTFMLGLSLIAIGASVIATYFGLPARPAYTSMAAFLLVTWGLAAGGRLDSITGQLDGDFEMFFESGVAMVTASTFIIIYNSDILLALVSRVGGTFGSILPALKTAVAYPMANRFRTGMTLAMISLVVFALTTMSAMNLNYDKLFLRDDSRGGWDVQVVENPNNPMPTVTEALAQTGSPVISEIRGEGAVLIAGFDSATEVAQADDDYDDYIVRGMTPSFIQNGSVPLDKIANGYDDEQAVWDALQTEDDVALVDGFVIQSGFGPNEFSVDGIPAEGDRFDSPVITVRDSISGVSRELRVIGVISFGASSNFMGIYMGEQAWRGVFGDPDMSVHFLALLDPDKSRSVAREIESALVTSGAQADSLQEIAEENNALSRNFLYLMQAFMGLGLVVGIAAIGVIAFRTVVERRQQIGMLRAIGYKKSMVSLSFLLESSYVTVLGVASGTFLGLWLAYFLVTSDDFPGQDQRFYIPWLEIGVISGLTIAASVLMTLIPARQAASVPTAEALRYE